MLGAPMYADRQRTESRLRAQTIFEKIRARICLLDYPPGNVLREQDLAAEFEVSRTPIRRVLQRLEHDGLVYSRQGHGTIVTTTDLGKLRDIYFVRMKLAEAIGASGPEPPRPETIEQLRLLARRCESILDAPDQRVFGEINIGLHDQIHGVIRNETLRRLSDQLFYQTARLWFYLLPTLDWKEEISDLQQEILQVTDAMRVGDLVALGYIHRNHLSMVMIRLWHRSGADAFGLRRSSSPGLPP
jgi:DNA-binding GntR family transcriptional regulator